MQTQSEGRSVEQIVGAIQALDLEPIKFKLMDIEEGQGWSREYVEQMAIAYKRFLTLSVKYPEETIAPSKDVTMISRCSSPMPEMMVWPDSSSVCTRKDGSSCASRWSATPIISGMGELHLEI